LRDPDGESPRFNTGYAEYFGGRYMLTQRVYWEDNWKFVLNGFDFDELYNLEADPYEMKNLARDPAYEDKVKHMMKGVWRRIRDTNDHSLYNAHYPILRLAPYGPGIIDEENQA
jgi:arylsulfatase A-like enzyme